LKSLWKWQSTAIPAHAINYFLDTIISTPVLQPSSLPPSPSDNEHLKHEHVDVDMKITHFAHYLLVRLWNAVIPDEPRPYNINSPADIKSVLCDPRWRWLGFQNDQPLTDFRGSGFLGLWCLVYLAEKSGHQHVATDSSSDGTLSCICSFVLSKYYFIGSFSLFLEAVFFKRNDSLVSFNESFLKEF
jgi:hypothetical protein